MQNGNRSICLTFQKLFKRRSVLRKASIIYNTLETENSFNFIKLIKYARLQREIEVYKVLINFPRRKIKSDLLVEKIQFFAFFYLLKELMFSKAYFPSFIIHFVLFFIFFRKLFLTRDFFSNVFCFVGAICRLDFWGSLDGINISIGVLRIGSLRALRGRNFKKFTH
jgi:hypothetical protein